MDQHEFMDLLRVLVLIAGLGLVVQGCRWTNALINEAERPASTPLTTDH